MSVPSLPVSLLLVFLRTLGGSSIAANSSQNSLPGGSSIAAIASQNSLPQGSFMAVNADMNSTSTEPTCELATTFLRTHFHAATHWFVFVKKIFLDQTFGNCRLNYITTVTFASPI